MSDLLKRCRGCDARKPLGEFGKDASCADGKRARCLVCDRKSAQGRTWPRTVDRVLRSRAANRAMAQLRDRYREEYGTLYAEAMTAARAEAAEHVAAQPAQPPKTPTCPAPPVPLLKPGPAQIGQAAPRLREDVGTCPLCINRHDRGHACPACGSRPQMSGPVTPARPHLVRVEDYVR